jgi:hypothetical protein
VWPDDVYPHQLAYTPKQLSHSAAGGVDIATLVVVTPDTSKTYSRGARDTKSQVAFDTRPSIIDIILNRALGLSLAKLRSWLCWMEAPGDLASDR